MLVNPNARRGTVTLDPVVARLEAGGIEVAIERFDTPDEVSADIINRGGAFDLVIVCGGDGTINSAARGVLATGLPMGILPMGTANDLARTLAISDNLLAAADVIIAGKRRRVDLGEVNGKTFFNVASIGLSAELAGGLSRDQAALGQAWLRRGGAQGAEQGSAVLGDDHLTRRRGEGEDLPDRGGQRPALWRRHGDRGECRNR